MFKTLILSLSDNVENKCAEYLFNGEKYENIYQLEIIFEKLDFDKVICFGTPKSSWSYFFGLVAKKFNVKSLNVEDVAELIGDEKNIFDDIEFMEDLLKNDIFGIDELKDKIFIEYYDIEKEKSKNELIEYISKFNNILKKSKKLYLDLTGGQRDYPIFIISLMSLFVDKYYDDLNVEIIYAKYRDKKKYELIFLNEIFEILKKTNGLSLFSKYGSPYNLKNIDSKLKKNLTQIYIYSQFNVVGNFLKKLENIKTFNEKSSLEEYIVNFKLKEWKNNINKANNDKDKMFKYHILLNNKTLALISKYEEMKDISGDEKAKELKNIRHSIVHPYDRKGMKYDLIVDKMKTLNFYEGAKDETTVLIVNMGDPTRYTNKIYSINGKEKEYVFPFETVISNKIKRVIFITDDIINIKKFIKIKRNKENVIESELEKELESVDVRYEYIIYNREYDLGFDIKYLDEMLNKLYSNNKKSNIIYDITFSPRDLTMSTYLNIYILEMLGIVSIKRIYYAKEMENNRNEIFNMDNFNNIINLYKLSEEFKKYNRFDNKLEVNSELKLLMEKVSNIYDVNQITTLYDLKDKILNFESFENEIEKDIVLNIQERIDLSLSQKEEKAIKMIKEQFQFNNLAQSIYLLCDLILNGLLDDDIISKNVDSKLKNEFIKNSDKYGFSELKEFFEKYETLFSLRRNSAHLNERYTEINITKNVIFECTEELKKLLKNSRIYSNKFRETLK